MRIKKLFLCLALAMALITPAGYADQCATSCPSTDPVELTQCLLECEAE